MKMEFIFAPLLIQQQFLSYEQQDLLMYSTEVKSTNIEVHWVKQHQFQYPTRKQHD